MFLFLFVGRVFKLRYMPEGVVTNSKLAHLGSDGEIDPIGTEIEREEDGVRVAARPQKRKPLMWSWFLHGGLENTAW
jgi:hypothetical protein